MELKELTERLCSLRGPSGFEGEVFDFAASCLRPFSDEIKTDALGNLMAVKRCGRPGARMLLMDAHLDEIGLIVTSSEKGFLRFAALGGVDPRMLPAREVCILTEPPRFGVIAAMPPHALKAEDMDKSVDIKDLAIDAGLSAEEADKLVPPGTPVVFAAGCSALGKHQICGKSLDDRACAAILIKAFEELSGRELAVDLCLLLSTQEEVGGRGAMTGAWNIDPDYALVVDVTHGKTPDGKDVTLEVGKGAAIGVGPNMNRALTRRLFELASEQNIPVQTEVCPRGSGTNAEEIQVTRTGVATVLVSLPLKYMHTPVETVSLDDMDSVLRLTTAFAAELEG